jgi:uncharacterized alkaline shock family protein YloU
MTRETTSLGRIMIATKAMATIATHAALQSYGVVGMASKNFVDGLADLLTHDPRRGVEVKAENGVINIDIYIVVEYGTRIASVATSVANGVHYQVERAVGLPVDSVNVHVQDLRISSID